MKKILLMLALLLPLAGEAQDTAAAIVGRYLRLLNYEALPADSTLVVETTIRFHNSTDTFHMRRLYARGGMMRVEVWRGDSLTVGLCTNGTTRFRKYSPYLGYWNDTEDSVLNNDLENYDLRGPLYHWRQKGVELEYRGVRNVKGQELQVVVARRKDYYTRHYMFEEQSGLLVLILEEDDLPVDDRPYYAVRTKPLQYKVYHEYMPVGWSLVPSQESYMRDNLLTIMESTSRLEARDPLLFNQD